MVYGFLCDFIIHMETKKYEENTLVILSFTDFRISMHSFRSRIMNEKRAQGRKSRHTPKTANFFLTPMMSVQL